MLQTKLHRSSHFRFPSNHGRIFRGDKFKFVYNRKGKLMRLYRWKNGKRIRYII